MQAIANAPEKRQHLEDEYLGFHIRAVDCTYIATPRGWHGEELAAESLPVIRRKIWRWWHQVQEVPVLVNASE